MLLSFLARNIFKRRAILKNHYYQFKMRKMSQFIILHII